MKRRVHPLVRQLRAARRSLGRTQADVAREIGVAREVLIRWENGENAPRLELLEAYARALGARLMLRFPPAVDAAAVELAAAGEAAGRLSLHERYAAFSLLRARPLTDRQVAARLGVTRRTVQRYRAVARSRHLAAPAARGNGL